MNEDQETPAAAEEETAPAAANATPPSTGTTTGTAAGSSPAILALLLLKRGVECPNSQTHQAPASQYDNFRLSLLHVLMLAVSLLDAYLVTTRY